MGLVDIGIQTIAGAMGGSGTIPSHIAIGTGSDTITAGDTTLLTEVTSLRNALTELDTSVAKDVTYVADYGSVELSGTTLTEFGLFNASGIDLGSMFTREVVAGIAFEGDRELQIQATLRFAKSGT